MSGVIRVSEDLCANFRERVDDGTSPVKVAEENDLSAGTVQYHVYGECSHEIETPPLTPSGPGLPEEKCSRLRSGYASGEDANSLADTHGHTWKTVVRHLTGECSHGEGELTVDKHDIFKRMPVSEADCRNLRVSYFEADSPDLLEFSKDVPWVYSTVITHLNGSCNHEIETQSRTKGERAKITKGLCQEFRQRYRENTDLNLSDLSVLAEDYEASAGSIQRHIRFRCGHEPESTLLTEVDGWQDLVNQNVVSELDEVDEEIQDESLAEPTEDLPTEYAEIAETTGVPSPDKSEAGADLARPETDRVKTTVSRIVRNTHLAKELKQQYQNHCQVCGDTRHRTPLEHYSEVHHIKPLGRPHEGPDLKKNMLVLCPNHHADFDHGVVHIDPDNLEITHATDDAVSGDTLRMKDEHELGRDLIKYHNEQISKL